MYGGDIGTLKVHVNTRNPDLGSRSKWLDSGGSESIVTVAIRCTVMSINTK